MAMQKMLASKRHGQQLSATEVEQFIKMASSSECHDAQIGAMLMAISINGMTPKETADLTSFMVKSGRQMVWPGLVGDKHSTGGVGDKVSIPLAPMLAELGLSVPMISGRSLEFTGGTLDKLESIPGFNVNLTEEKMRKSLENVGCFIAAATGDICPADKKLYSIRDVTSTVDCNSLVTASILSKKIAEGAKYLIQDIKVGEAAFYKDVNSAKELAKLMISTADHFGLKMAASLTRMDHPIGKAVGNALEIKECISILRGEHFPKDLMELILELGGELLVMTGLSSTLENAKEMMIGTLKDNKALKRFENMLVNQGVSEEVAQKLCFKKDMSLLPTAKFQTEFKTPKQGFIEKINALIIARICFKLGGGRNVPSEAIDHAVGCEILVEQGENVDAGKCWAVLHHNLSLTEDIPLEMNSALTVSSKPVLTLPRLIETIRAQNC